MEPLIWDGAANKIAVRIIGSPLEEERDVDRESLRYELDINRLGKSSSYRIEGFIMADDEVLFKLRAKNSGNRGLNYDFG